MTFNIQNSGGNIVNLLRKAGYLFMHQDDKTSQFVFARPLERSGYPRFHLYIGQKDNILIFNLHLDQKRPIYKGATAHSGEYDSPLVEQEAERIKQILG
ncbi:MAG: hypothetical protein Q8N69_03220 [bacterium]|nr:hypothetical protein [bacterium]